jgi:aspartate/methionine/tyrosine aminotransferase
MLDTITTAELSHAARGAPDSGIVEVANYGRLKDDIIRLWVGEGEMPTSSFIIEAAERSLRAGETFYTWQRGIPDLRQAIARMMSDLYGQPLDVERFFVTGSGMQALQIVMRLVTNAGDEVIIPSPAWPNFEAAIGINGGKPVNVPMTFQQTGWTLDIARLETAITPASKAICINSPANPTGWTATRDELQAILALARKHNLWIVADEIYGRFVYDSSRRAASFHDLMEENDRIIFVQTFSKNWAMTGWRLGWIEAPPVFGPAIENLIQYSTSGSPVFIQRAAIAAIEQGEAIIQDQLAKAKRNRQILVDALTATGRAKVAPPAGAFYLFFGLDGVNDAHSTVFRLIDEAGVGLAPGTAFGPGGEAFFRLCYARSTAHIEEAAERLVKWLQNNR